MIDHAAVNLDAKMRQPVLRALHHFEIGIDGKLHMDPLHANLFQEEKMIVVGPRVHHGGDLGVVRIIFVHTRCRASSERRRGDGLSRGGSQRELQKISALGGFHKIPPELGLYTILAPRRVYRWCMALSARNQLQGKIEKITIGDIMAHVVVKLGKFTIESVITRQSAKEMKLKKGDSVEVVIKATEVMLRK